MGSPAASPPHSFPCSSARSHTKPRYGLHHRPRSIHAIPPTPPPNPAISQCTTLNATPASGPISHFPELQLLWLPETSPSPSALANLYTYLLVDAKPITILSDPDGVPKLHVSFLRTVLQTFSEERVFIINVRDAACDACVKHLKEMNWIKHTYRKRSLRFKLKRYNRKARKSKDKRRLTCTHEHKLKKFSDSVLPSNCARIHNLILRIDQEHPRVDTCVLRSAVTNIISYIPNLKSITIRHKSRKEKAPLRNSNNPDAFKRLPRRRTSYTGGGSGMTQTANGTGGLLGGGRTRAYELDESTGRWKRYHRSVAQRVGWEALDGTQLLEQRDYLECFKLLEQELPHGRRLVLKGKELYPGMSRDWRNHGRRWFE